MVTSTLYAIATFWLDAATSRSVTSRAGRTLAPDAVMRGSPSATTSEQSFTERPNGLGIVSLKRTTTA